MVALQMFTNRVFNDQRNPNVVIKNNWRQLYNRDSQYTYSEATLVLPKNKRK